MSIPAPTYTNVNIPILDNEDIIGANRAAFNSWVVETTSPVISDLQGPFPTVPNMRGFTAPDTLTSVDLLMRGLSVTNICQMSIFQGTPPALFTSLPTPLAVSDQVNIAQSGTLSHYSFPFTGVNQILLNPGQMYFFMIVPILGTLYYGRTDQSFLYSNGTWYEKNQLSDTIHVKNGFNITFRINMNGPPITSGAYNTIYLVDPDPPVSPDDVFGNPSSDGDYTGDITFPLIPASGDLNDINGNPITGVTFNITSTYTGANTGSEYSSFIVNSSNLTGTVVGVASADELKTELCGSISEAIHKFIAQMSKNVVIVSKCVENINKMADEKDLL